MHTVEARTILSPQNSMKERCNRAFGNRYVLMSPDNERLTAIFHAECARHGIMHDNRQIFDYLRTLEPTPHPTLF